MSELSVYERLTVEEMRRAVGRPVFAKCMNKAMMLALIPSLSPEQQSVLTQLANAKPARGLLTRSMTERKVSS
jgi:hypothetical protein